MSPENPGKKPKMAQGRKAGERPLDDAQTRLNKAITTSRKLQEKKIMEIVDRQDQKD